MEDDFNPPDICADGRCRDMTGDFVLTVVIPVVLVLILALVSAVLLFRRTKRYYLSNSLKIIVKC